MKIEQKIPTDLEVDFLKKKIVEASQGYGDMDSFAFLIRDEGGEIIAGASGYSSFGSIYTNYLWVHADYRERGLASQIMAKVHEYGRQLGYKMATLCTMNFHNTQKFYEKLGYNLEFERSGYQDDASCLFLRKML
jgi:GNAT superfamily N-acetyltransferase